MPRASRPPRALEHHMLDEVGEPALAVGLRARADRGVEPDRGRLRAVHRVDRDRHAVGQAGELSHWPASSLALAALEREDVDQRGERRRTGTTGWRSSDDCWGSTSGDGSALATSPGPGSAATSRIRADAVGRDDAADQPALIVAPGIGVLRPAKLDRHARPFGADAAVGDDQEAGLAGAVLAGGGAEAGHLQAIAGGRAEQGQRRRRRRGWARRSAASPAPRASVSSSAAFRRGAAAARCRARSSSRPRRRRGSSG